jgi:hypothetical protein
MIDLRVLLVEKEKRKEDITKVIESVKGEKTQ